MRLSEAFSMVVDSGNENFTENLAKKDCACIGAYDVLCRGLVFC